MPLLNAFGIIFVSDVSRTIFVFDEFGTTISVFDDFGTTISVFNDSGSTAVSSDLK